MHHEYWHDHSLDVYKRHVFWKDNCIGYVYYRVEGDPAYVKAPHPTSIFDGLYYKNNNQEFVPYKPWLYQGSRSYELYIKNYLGDYELSGLYMRYNSFVSNRLIDDTTLEIPTNIDLGGGLQHNVKIFRSSSEVLPYLNSIHDENPAKTLDHHKLYRYKETINRPNCPPPFDKDYLKQIKDSFARARNSDVD